MSDLKRRIAALIIALLAVVLIGVSAWALVGQSLGIEASLPETTQAQEQATETSEGSVVDSQTNESSQQSDSGSESVKADSEPGVSSQGSTSSQSNSSVQGKSGSSPNSGSGANSGSDSSDSFRVSIQVVADGVDQPLSISRSVTLSQGASVYDALVNTGLSVSASSSSYGMYVRSIQGLAEKQYGSNSGWMYSVNGVTPMTACSNYFLKSGDSVVWYYVI